MARTGKEPQHPQAEVLQQKKTLEQMIEALAPLNEEARARVLKSVAIFFGLDQLEDDS